MKAYKAFRMVKGVLWSVFGGAATHAIKYVINGHKNVPPQGWGPLAAEETEEAAITWAKTRLSNIDWLVNGEAVYRESMHVVVHEVDVELSKLNHAYWMLRFPKPSYQGVMNAPVVEVDGKPMVKEWDYVPVGSLACDSVIIGRLTWEKEVVAGESIKGDMK